MHLPTSAEQRIESNRIGLYIPVGILLAIYTASNWIQLDALSQKHRQLVAAEQQLARDDVKRQLGNAELASSKLEALVKEIVALAPADPVARQIAEQYHLPLPAASATEVAPAQPSSGAKADAAKVSAVPAPDKAPPKR